MRQMIATQCFQHLLAIVGALNVAFQFFNALRDNLSSIFLFSINPCEG